MKKALTIIVILLAVTLFASCGNMKIGFGNFKFCKVHIIRHNGTDICIRIINWYDVSTGIEVITEEYGTLFLSEGTYILCEDECPICGREEVNR